MSATRAKWVARLPVGRVVVAIGPVVLAVVLGFPPGAVAQRGERMLGVAQVPASPAGVIPGGPIPSIPSQPDETAPLTPPPTTVPSARPPVLPPGLTEILAGPAVRPRAVFYRENKFTGVAVGPAGRAETGRTEDARGGSLALAIPILRWLTLAVEYTYTDVDSSVSGRDYTENRARATLSALF